MKMIEILKEQFDDFEVIEEKWNEQYEGILIKVNGQSRYKRCRLAHKTPRKEGYFTAFWKKDQFNKNIPFSDRDMIDELIIVINDGQQKGLFLIPKNVSITQNIISTKTSKGKMAMRFYPPWCQDLNKTALATQKWQLNYFIDLSEKEQNYFNFKKGNEYP